MYLFKMSSNIIQIQNYKCSRTKQKKKIYQNRMNRNTIYTWSSLLLFSEIVSLLFCPQLNSSNSNEKLSSCSFRLNDNSRNNRLQLPMIRCFVFERISLYISFKVSENNGKSFGWGKNSTTVDRKTIVKALVKNQMKEFFSQ